MKRRSVSTSLLALGGLLVFLSWLLAFNWVGFYAYVFGVLFVAAGFAIYPRLGRLVAAAGISTLYLYYTGALVLLLLALYHLLRPSFRRRARSI